MRTMSRPKVLFTLFVVLFSQAALPTVIVADTASTKKSLYHVKAEFLDQDSRTLVFSSLQGKPLIISMYYASCPFACPILLAKLKNLDARLTPATQSKVHYLLISFDPQRDTPAKLKKLAGDYKLDEKRWRLVQAKENDVRLFAALLGVTYRKLQNGEYSHNTVITLLDKDGVIDRQIDGQQTVPDDFVQRMEHLVKP